MFENIKMQKITMTLIGINVTIFILMSLSNFLFISPNPVVSMYDYILVHLSMFNGSNFIISIFTSAFAHVDALHLGMNMFGLYLFGNMIEYHIKSKDFILLYLVSLIFSGIVSILFLNYLSNNLNFVVGASGAIFGVWAFYSFYTDTVKEFLIYFLIYHVLIFITGMNIAWYSHMGGALGGILFWFLYYNKKRKIGGMVLWR